VQAWILIAVALVAVFAIAKLAGRLRQKPAGSGTRQARSRSMGKRPSPPFSFWLGSLFTGLLALVIGCGIPAAIGYAATQNEAGAVLGGVIGLLLVLRRRIVRLFARLFKKRCLATYLQTADEAPPGAPSSYWTTALFDCSGQRHKLKLTPRQAWQLSHERMGEIGHLAYGGKHLFSWAPVSPEEPEREPVGAGVFISYAHEQAEEARYLSHVLRSHGLDVWLDENRLSVGDALNQALPVEVEAARFFMPILSADYLASQWCMREFQYAADAEIDIRPVKYTTESLPFPPQFRELFEEQLGSPVYLDVNSGNLPQRVHDLAREMAQTAVDEPKAHPIRVPPAARAPSAFAGSAQEASMPAAALDLSDETPVDISRWLGEIGLSQYAENFAENDIDSMQLLRTLNDQDLIALGIRSLGHRKRLLAELQFLQDR